MMPPIASQRRPAMGFCASSFTSWSSLHRRRLSQAKTDSETTARQLENSNFHCRMCSPSNTPSHPISITCNRDERCGGSKLCVEAAVQMSDDVEARFAAVRVSYQQGHIPCRSVRFTRSCARETNQQSSRISSVTASPAKQVQVFRKKPRSHARESNPLRETINVSLERFASR